MGVKDLEWILKNPPDWLKPHRSEEGRLEFERRLFELTGTPPSCFIYLGEGAGEEWIKICTSREYPMHLWELAMVANQNVLTALKGHIKIRGDEFNVFLDGPAIGDVESSILSHILISGSCGRAADTPIRAHAWVVDVSEELIEYGLLKTKGCMSGAKNAIDMTTGTNILFPYALKVPLDFGLLPKLISLVKRGGSTTHFMLGNTASNDYRNGMFTYLGHLRDIMGWNDRAILGFQLRSGDPAEVGGIVSAYTGEFFRAIQRRAPLLLGEREGEFSVRINDEASTMDIIHREPVGNGYVERCLYPSGKFTREGLPNLLYEHGFRSRAMVIYQTADNSEDPDDHRIIYLEGMREYVLKEAKRPAGMRDKFAFVVVEPVEVLLKEGYLKSVKNRLEEIYPDSKGETAEERLYNALVSFQDSLVAGRKEERKNKSYIDNPKEIMFVDSMRNLIARSLWVLTLYRLNPEMAYCPRPFDSGLGNQVETLLSPHVLLPK